MFRICKRRHCSLEGKVVNSSEYVMSQQNVRYEWNEIPWRKLEKSSFKLQKRIYRASQCNDIKKMHNLQRLLLRSTSARTLAVRKVTQDNRGKKTAGIDGKANLNQKERLQLVYSLDIREKAKPSRRVWIPKPGRRVDRRSFPTSLSQNCTETSRLIQLPLFSLLILTQVSNDRKYLETSFSLFLEIALLVFRDHEVSYILS